MSVDRHEGGNAIIKPSPSVRIVVPADCAVGAELEVSIRPEKISIVAGHGHPVNGHEGSRVEGVAVERVYLGSVSQTSSSFPTAIALPSTSSTTTASPAIRPGDAVTLLWATRHSLVVAEELGAGP